MNYLIGDRQVNWHTDIPTFGRVKYSNVYPGVDVVHYGVGDTLEYDIVAAPGADTSKIKLAVEGDAKTVIDKDGNLQILTAAGVVVMHKPTVYQHDADGNRTPVDGGFVLAKDGTIEDRIPRRDVRFQLAKYDHSRELVIDPVSAILDLLDLHRRDCVEHRPGEPRAVRGSHRRHGVDGGRRGPGRSARLEPITRT